MSWTDWLKVAARVVVAVCCVVIGVAAFYNIKVGRGL